MIRKLGIVWLLAVSTIIVSSTTGFAQEIQNSLSYRDVDSGGYFRFNYENDVIFGTDRYFTQGVHFELVNRGLRQSFIRRLFPSGKRGNRWCGLGLESAGYSPTSITADSILFGDHPFAGLAYVKLFSVSIDTTRRRRVAGTLSLGWMGPSAGGYEIQSAIHRAVGSAEPLGWKYQLKDQPVVNYELNVEQGLGNTPRWLRLSAWGMARAGTLSNKLAVGCLATIQMPVSSRTAFRAYVHPALNFVAYESVLQGGPFTRDNPYSIASRDVKRVVGSCIAGLDARAGKFYLGAYLRWQSPTFNGGTDHALGGITVGKVL